MKIKKYTKFILMMMTSYIIMYAAMFLNLAEIDHFMLSNNRAYMAFLMVSPMAIVMLLFMLPMYTNRKKNAAIFGISTILFCLFFYMLRTQAFISNVQYMRGMIPHHSSAIMTSQNAAIKDPATKELSKEIIKAQKREIAEMKKIIERLENEQ